MAAKFALFVDEDHSKLPTFYWLPKLHKRPYKSRFIANSSTCTTSELSILLTSCLTAIKNYVIKYCTTVYERNGKRGSCMVWEINMGVCPRLSFDNTMLFNCLGYHFNMHGAFEFLCNSIADL